MDHRCPICKKFWIKVENELLSSEYIKTVDHTTYIDRGADGSIIRERHDDLLGSYSSDPNVVRVDEEHSSYRVYEDTYKYTHTCRHCGHSWTETIAFNRAE